MLKVGGRPPPRGPAEEARWKKEVEVETEGTSQEVLLSHSSSGLYDKKGILGKMEKPMEVRGAEQKGKAQRGDNTRKNISRDMRGDTKPGPHLLRRLWEGKGEADGSKKHQHRETRPAITGNELISL